MEDEGGDAEEGGGKSVIRGLSRAARKAILPSGGFSCHQRKLQLTLSDLKARICALEDEEGRAPDLEERFRALEEAFSR
jgi:hypothetical protein